jgi:hypothetical protein
MKKLVWVDYDGDGISFIGYSDDASYGRIVKGPEMTLEDIADFCDQNAEGRNNHSMVGIHRLLAVLLYNQFGRAEATKTLHMIAESGGLDEMSGDIPEPWNDWKLGE